MTNYSIYIPSRLIIIKLQCENGESLVINLSEMLRHCVIVLICSTILKPNSCIDLLHISDN